jgi:hypothetical protein
MSMTDVPEPLPHFRRRASDPALPPGSVGVLVFTSGVDTSSGARSWPLRGCFRVPRADGGAEPQAALQRIVVSLTDLSAHEVRARHAFRDELLFTEDVQVEGALVSGDFHVDLLRLFELDVPNETYFVSASIGDDVSPIVRCSCHMPWLAPPPDEPLAADTGSSEASSKDEDDKADAEEEEDDDDRRWMINDPLPK